MIDATFPTLARGSASLSDGNVLFKAVVTLLFCAATIGLAPILGPIGTFIGLDVVLSAYLVALFRGKYRYLFLIHPVFMLVSSYGFEIPYSEIAVGYTYIHNLGRFIDPNTLSLDTDLVIQRILFDQGDFGFMGIYVGTMPILLLPQIVFDNAPDITIYFSMGVFTLLYAAIAVSLSLHFGVMRKKVLHVIALFSTVSPTFFEINSSLHRYGLLFFGFFLFVIAYSGFLQPAQNSPRKFSLSFVMLVAIVLVTVSKPPLLMCLALFVLLELFSRNKLSLVSHLFSRLTKRSKVVVLVILIVIAQNIATFLVPEKYALHFSQQGGQYAALINIPIIGLVLRVVYAMLSPFPWADFDQWDTYGYNELFLWVHILSAFFATWIIFSFSSRLPNILKGADDVRIVSLAGVAVLGSLAFSSIGYNAYLAPALPFLAVVLLENQFRVPFIYPTGFIAVMEGVAQVARVLR